MRSPARWLLLVPVLAACGAASLPDGGVVSDATPLSDFSLVDVNPASASSGQNVSPRDFQGRVSAWYFGHSS